MLWCSPRSISARINLPYGTVDNRTIAVSFNQIETAVADASSLIEGKCQNFVGIPVGREIVASPIELSDTSIVLASPAVDVVGDYLAVGDEVMLVTNVSPDKLTLTVTRGQLGTTAIARQELNELYGFALVCNVRLLRAASNTMVRICSRIAAFNAIILRGFKPESAIDNVYRNAHDFELAQLDAIQNDQAHSVSYYFPSLAVNTTQQPSIAATIDASTNPAFYPSTTGRTQ